MNLADFGYGVPDPDPPQVERKRVRWAPKHESGNDSHKIAGFIGRVFNRGEMLPSGDHRGAKCYISFRTGKHFYQNGQGWAVSKSVLSACERVGVGWVFIWDGNTGDVWEFRARQFHRGREVPAADREHPRDEQIYVPIEEAVETWEGHADEMFKRSFERAMEHVT